MPDLTVHRHGDRWAILERGAESPVKELATRDAAEVAARQMAGGGAVNVVEEDPSGLAAGQDRREPEHGDDVDADTRLDAPEHSEGRQGGL